MPRVPDFGRRSASNRVHDRLRLGPEGLLVLAAVVAAACGQASPQGLDDLNAKPGFGVLNITPVKPEVLPGETVQFVLRNGNGARVDGPVSWRAAGGTISKAGRYVAGMTPGTYTVSASTRGGSASQSVTIRTPSTSSPSPTPSDPQPPDDDDPDPPPSDPEPPSYTTKFADDFESYDFRRWGGWAPLGDPYANGMGDGGAHIGEGWVTTEMAHTGRYAWRAQVDPATQQPSNWPVGKSSLERWRVLDGTYDFTVSAWYYFPADYPSDVWSNLMQIKESQSPHDPPAVVAIDRDRKLLLYEGLYKTVVKKSSVVVPRGRWVNIKTRFVIDHTRGRVTTWLDGQLVFDITGMNTLGHTTTTDVWFGVGNYVAASTVTRCHVYIDDVIVTS